MIDGIDVNDRHGLVQNLRPRLHELPCPLVEVGPLHEESVYVDPLGRMLVDLVLAVPGDQVLGDHTVQGPALVGASHLLLHGREEALGIEEARHPEDLGSAPVTPGPELSVSLNKLSEPEAESGARPGDLGPLIWDLGVKHAVQDNL